MPLVNTVRFVPCWQAVYALLLCTVLLCWDIDIDIDNDAMLVLLLCILLDASVVRRRGAMAHGHLRSWVCVFHHCWYSVHMYCVRLCVSHRYLFFLSITGPTSYRVSRSNHRGDDIRHMNMTKKSPESKLSHLMATRTHNKTAVFWLETYAGQTFVYRSRHGLNPLKVTRFSIQFMA